MKKIYQFHLKLKTQPSKFIKYLPKMNNEKLYQTFFLYYTDWHRLYCNDCICEAPQILNYCSSFSLNAKEFMKNLFFYLNKPKLVNNA
jgi:hypothetical protein